MLVSGCSILPKRKENHPPVAVIVVRPVKAPNGGYFKSRNNREDSRFKKRSSR